MALLKLAILALVIVVAWLGYINQLNEVVNVFSDQITYAYVELSDKIRELLQS